MVEIILLTILFIIGIYFGSFFTLATYRLPKRENITHKHSYCPNCNHKLGLLDLVPVFSYLALRGKCRYCKNPIGIRYVSFEFITGIVFVLFGLSLNINLYELEINKMIDLALGILYFASLFIIGGISKEKNVMQTSVLYYGVGIAILYILYSYTLNCNNVYKYVMYLSMMLILLFLDTKLLKKKLQYNDTLQIAILSVYMLIMTGEYIGLATFIFAILVMGIKNIIKVVVSRKSVRVVTKKEKQPFALYMCAANIIMLIGTNFLINYMIR